jgi:hypothetical protein
VLAQFFVLFKAYEQKLSINNIGNKISVSTSKKAHCIPITNAIPFMMIWKESYKTLILHMQDSEFLNGQNGVAFKEP